ncbi:MAG: sn-glycerol-3-phosphate ABC transporter ATP-binding protein UgpC [Betaproteobacteria bacterium]|nr:sn-glycerol-3-phosphate ABC transporter ATP-binding protein UgpC [Betaproteobacteria bacterium]
MANLSLSSVRKSFGQQEILHGIDLDVQDGEFVVFVGPSGCGKSTLLRLIAGLDEVTAGDIVLDGKTVTRVAAAERGLSMVFQNYALYPHMTVYQNLAFGLENTPMKRSDIDQRVHKAADLLQLSQLLGRKPRQLSGGQRQRVAIGRSITRQPKIFLFDEPLSNLDAELRVQMRLELSKLHKDLRATMIYVTHDQVEAMTMADKIVVLRDGQVEQVGRPLDLYNNPANRFVAGFIGSPRMNFLGATVTHSPDGPPRISAEGLALSAAHLPLGQLQAQTPVTIGIRPEHLALGTAQDWPLEVSVVEQLGNTSYVHGTLPSAAALTIALNDQTAIRVGSTIFIKPIAGKVHVFLRAGTEVAMKPNP